MTGSPTPPPVEVAARAYLAAAANLRLARAATPTRPRPAGWVANVLLDGTLALDAPGHITRTVSVSPQACKDATITSWDADSTSPQALAALEDGRRDALTVLLAAAQADSEETR